MRPANTSIQEIAKIEQPFTHTIQALGGVPPYDWEWDDNVPEGLKLIKQNDKLVISGTPAKVENRVIHLTLTDANPDKKANSSTKDITVNVRDKSKDEIEAAKQAESEKALKKASGGGCSRNADAAAGAGNLLPLLLLGLLLLLPRRKPLDAKF